MTPSTHCQMLPRLADTWPTRPGVTYHRANTHNTLSLSSILLRSWPSNCRASDSITERWPLFALPWSCQLSLLILFYSFQFQPSLALERRLANDTLALKSRSSWEQSDSRGGGLKELASHPSPLESGKGSRPESRSQWWLLSGFFSYLLHEGCDPRGVQRTSCSQSSSTSHINIKCYLMLFQNNAA